MGEGEGLQWNDQHSALVHADGTIEDQMFKLHFVDGEGDSVLVSTHTEIDDLLNCASITARLEPAVEQ